MQMHGAWQLKRQRLAPGALALPFGGRFFLEFFFDCGQIRINRFFEQQTLFARQRFAGLAEARGAAPDAPNSRFEQHCQD